MIENAEQAVKYACNQTQCSIKDYTVAPVYFKGKEKRMS